MTQSPSPLSIISLIGTMSLVAAGNGLLFTYVPFVLGSRDAEPWFAGAAVTAVAFGGLAGCVLAGPLIRRVGHARLFPVSLALVIIAALMIAVGFYPVVWVLARGLYGLASNINFILAQSWINHAASNSWRGKALSFFYMSYILCFGAGSWIFGQLPATGNLGPLATVFLTSLAIIPIGLTRLPAPPMPPALSMVKAVPLAWRVSPVGFIGVLTAGGISMAVQGFTPIYATAARIPQADVAMLSLVMQTGLLFVQYPIGMLSDRMDRRLVILITCGLIFGAGLAALTMDFGRLGLLMITFAVWAGAIESIYSLANAHANDRSAPDHFVPLSSALLVSWSTGATIVPMLITTVTPQFGPQTFIFAILILSLAYALFVASRMIVRK
ncbi:MFS transporter [Gellertiella hungarica]|uniref:MFS family permease n=1 Tax=Gellertiella hungarica TaxID=1572859 RepID=A0A7W6J9J2_9HYPH|nr:MFS transporter [Gellertiella hungarica]MBB4066422.1 MFS family permease [Gellertiella hungarica]